MFMFYEVSMQNYYFKIYNGEIIALLLFPYQLKIKSVPLIRIEHGMLCGSLRKQTESTQYNMVL